MNIKKIAVVIMAAMMIAGCSAQQGGNNSAAETTGAAETAGASEESTAAQEAVSEEETKELRQVDLVLDWYPNAIHAFIYEAIEKGYYAEEGLEVNLQVPTGTNDALSLVAAGRAELGFYYQMDMLQARAEHDVRVKSLGAIVHGPLDTILSMKEAGINSPKDLVGKKVGYMGGEMTEVMVKTLMEADGADASDVELIDVGFDLLSALTTGRVDATTGCLVNHEVPQLEEEGFEIQYFMSDEYGVPTNYQGIFVASDSTIENDPEMLAGFLRASKKGFEDMKADPEEALQILLAHQDEANFPLSETVERKSIEILLPMMETEDKPFLSQSDEIWQANVDWMLETGLIHEAPDLDSLRVNLEY